MPVEPHIGTGIVVRDADIEAAVDRCIAAGAPVPLPVLELAPGIRIAMIEDPEGTRVDLIETASDG